MRFDDLKLSEAVLQAVHAEGYENPTPIQQKAIPHVLEGKDLMGCAQTGTGKTAAFALPILSRLGEATGTDGSSDSARSPRAHTAFRPIRVLVLTPTRELAVQIAESFTTYGKFTGMQAGLIFGGVSQGGQERMLRAGVDIVVATPGRLMDMMNQRLVNLSTVEVFVLDEADRMLDMGFIADIRKIIARLPTRRQTLMFSATMPPEIKRLADGILYQPVHVAVAPIASTAERVEQSVYLLEVRAKPGLLLHLLATDSSINRVLIFTRTKHGADRLSKGLAKNGVPAEAIHGNKSQNQRQRALDTFKQGHTRVLVATDIAARGLDIELVSHVINYELPNIPESYVHRIGRTARAGESGIAISFCAPEEREFLRDIERLIGKRLPVVTTPLPNASASAPPSPSFGQERDSDRRALGGRGGPGRSGSRPPSHQASRSAPSGRPSPRPANEGQRPASSPKPSYPARTAPADSPSYSIESRSARPNAHRPTENRPRASEPVSGHRPYPSGQTSRGGNAGGSHRPSSSSGSGNGSGNVTRPGGPWRPARPAENRSRPSTFNGPGDSRDRNRDQGDAGRSFPRGSSSGPSGGGNEIRPSRPGPPSDNRGGPRHR